MRLAVFVVVCLLVDHVASAWNYSEHVEITHQALVTACSRLQVESDSHRQLPELFPICSDPQLQWCFAHMVGMAGDHFELPAELEAYLKSGSRALSRGKLNCRDAIYLLQGRTETNIDAYKNGENTRSGGGNCDDGVAGDKLEPSSSKTQSKCSLFPPTVRHWLRYGSLAAGNAKHFMPDSVRQWRLLTENVRNSPASESESLRWSEAAFALHYLEDSFASGHVGLNRSQYLHDYDNAFHDDFNAIGRYLSNANEIWYAFGDGYLREHPSFYLPISQFRTADREQRANLISGLHNAFPAFEFSKLVDNELANPHPKSANDYAFSLPKRIFWLNHWCFYMDDCEKQVVLLSESWDQHHPPANCSLLTTEPSIWRCEGETRRVLDEATAKSVETLFLYLTKNIELGDASAKQAQNELPTKYRGLMPNEHREFVSLINKEPSELEFTNWLPTEAFSEPPTREWGIAIEQATGGGPISSRTSVAWSIRLSDLTDFAKSLTGAGSRDEVPSAPYEHWALQNRYEVLDSRGYFLNSFEISGYYDRFRVLKKAFGITPKASIGIADLWEGGGKRNLYSGFGLATDMHVGKQLLYFEVEHQWHWNHGYGEFNLWKACFGIRVMSINQNGQ